MPEGAWWCELPDALLRLATVGARARFGRPWDPFAGLQITDEEVSRRLGEIARTSTGAEGNAPDDEAERVAVGSAAASFLDGLDGRCEFAQLCRSAQLDVHSAVVLALVVAVELLPARQRLVAYLNDDVQKVHCTVALLDEVLSPLHPGGLAVAPGSRLVLAGLVTVDPVAPLTSAAVRVPRVVAWHLAGGRCRDGDLPAGTRSVGVPGELPIEPGLALVVGGDRTSRLQLARARLGGSSALVVADPPADAWSPLIRQATVDGAVLVVELSRNMDRVDVDWIERATHLAIAISSPLEQPVEQLPDRALVELRVDPRQDVLDESGHRLDADQRRQVEVILPSVDGDLDAAVRRLASGLLEGLAVRVRPRRAWDDLVLAEDQLQELRDLADRYRHRPVVHGRWGVAAVPSSGVVALFVGPSGTGKTMAAEIVAGDLGLDLYKIDLSSVVSKYIGETEKQLERIFQAATAGNLVLFFDEADSLFGKRSDVSDAHDRYANIETSYLLQRIEAYDGFVILATNLQGNIDEAFLRRIHAQVQFAIPMPPERELIWRASLPASHVAADIDLSVVARIELSGGAIRSAALAASFLAASDGAPGVEAEHVVAAVHRELRKLGRLPQELSVEQVKRAPDPG